jgi:cytoskeleton protein RodZ
MTAQPQSNQHNPQQRFMNKHEQSGAEKQSMMSSEHQETKKADHATVGAMLRQLRQDKGISIRDAAKSTNISASNLVAIEHENYADLPASTFIRGQVRIYANLLGIDGAEAGRKFIAERERHQQLNEQKSGRARTMSAKKLAEPAHISAVTLAFCIILLIALFITGFCLYTGWNPFSYLLHRQQASPPTGQLMAAPEQEPAVEVQQTHPSVPHPAEQQHTAPAGN